MIHDIPVEPSIADYRFETTLDGTPLLFDVHWNARDNAWYIDVRDLDETPVVLGIKVVLGALLGRRSVETHIPDGVIVAVDTSGQGREAGFDDLGTRVKLRYFPMTDWLVNLS